MSGYLSQEYASSFAEFGTPRRLPRSAGWVIERPVAGTADRDAMGCYPLFSCTQWSKLGADLDELSPEVVSLAVVTDPFGDYNEALLNECFDFVRPFKEHHIVDLSRNPQEVASQHHRYYAQRSLRNATVDICREPQQYLDEWVLLYDTLVCRHQLRGIKSFSRASFARQLATPGMVMFLMQADAAILGAQLWFVQGEVAYNHLLAMSEAGYAVSASYGLCQAALAYFYSGGFDHVRYVDLGAGTGLGDSTDGLTKFKRGWATGIRPAFFCGRVFDAERYAALTRLAGAESAKYFPAYRQGEFG